MLRSIIAAGFAAGMLIIAPQAQAEPEAATVTKSYFAVVNLNGQLSRGTTGATSSKTGTGSYRVIFPVNVSKCTFISNVGSPNTTRENGGSTKVNSMPGNPKGVEVHTGSQGAAANRGFHLAVMC